MTTTHRYTTDDLTDDVLQLADPLSPREVQRRLDAAPWFYGFIRSEWRTRADAGPYVTAYAATARIVLATAVLGSRSPENLAQALDLQKMFVRLVLVSLDAAKWRTGVLPALMALAAGEVVDVDQIKGTLDEFMTSDLPDRVDFIDLLKAVGPEL